MDIIFQRDKDNPHFDSETNIIACAKDGIIECAVSALSIVNTVYVAKKYKMQPDDVKSALSQLTECVEFVDVKGKDASDILKSSDWKDYEDGIQYSSAANYGADYILTRNCKDFKPSDITICTPSEFIATMDSKE